MIRTRSKIHRSICLFLSASLFVESGFAAPSLSQTTITTAKEYLNATGMGKIQTLGEWFEKAKEYLDEDVIERMNYWVSQNKNKTIPPLTVKQVNTAKKGKYLLLTFKVDGHNVEYELHQDKNGPYIYSYGTVLRESDWTDSTLIEQVMRTDPILTYKQFRKLADKSPEWGVKYLNGLRQLQIEMERGQKVLFPKEKKTSSYFYELAIPHSYGEQVENGCQLAGWGGVWDSTNGNCTKSESPGKYAQYTCSNKGEIDCNPMIYGYKKGTDRFCVPLVPKEDVSAKYCDEKNPIYNAADFKKMTDQVDKVEGRNPGSTLMMIKGHITVFKERCLTSDQMNNADYLPFSKMKDVTENTFAKKFPAMQRDGQDRNAHNRLACKAFFHRLQFLEDTVAEQKPQTTPGVPTDQKKCIPGLVTADCPAKEPPLNCPVNNPNCKEVPGCPAGQTDCKSSGLCSGDSFKWCLGGGLLVGAGLLGLLIYALTRKSKKAKDGINGTNGMNGADGTNGKDGKDGANGINGKDGTNGINGKDGKDGANTTPTPTPNTNTQEFEIPREPGTGGR